MKNTRGFLQKNQSFFEIAGTAYPEACVHKYEYGQPFDHVKTEREQKQKEGILLMAEHQGLTSRAAEELLTRYGENRIKGRKKSGAFKILAGQFQDALIMILLAATLLSLFMGEVTEAITISAIIVINALLGFIQEFRTEKTLEKLGELSAPTAAVIRDGREVRIDAKLIVPGDLVRLRAGDRVPADGAILSCAGLSCDESMLSGESLSVEKTPAPPRGEPPKGSLVYMGTLVTGGKGLMRVRDTGDATEMGKIAGMLGEIESQATPLQKRLAQLSKYIGIGCLVICAVVATTGILRGEPILDMLLVGISLSVAAVPEGLPAIVTIALALSVGRMVKRHALVRRLHAVETLGCANVICSDKTGTLTENRMTVKVIRTPDDEILLSGSGLDLTGKFTAGSRELKPGSHPQLTRLLTIACMCNNASLERARSHGFGKVLRYAKPTAEVTGEPTEAALLIAAAKADIRREELPYQVEREIPFDSTRKRMSVVCSSADGVHQLFVKGAPDVLLPRCTHCLTASGVRPMDTRMRHRILSQNDGMADNALRVLGFAYRSASGSQDAAEENLIFVGLAGLLDPPRREAYDAVRKCRRAGIKPVMITGDHAITARAIARDLQIFREGNRIVSGAELDAMSDQALAEALPDITVFARVTPAHKLRIVRAFKARGDVVAMTGDGVNDAPAIKEADIGVSMGITGTDVTKEAASVILLDDNFATLVTAVEEGRVIYQNIRKFIRYLLSCNIGEVFTMFFAMLIGMPVPLIPIQILLINLITDGLPAIALGLEPAEPDIMDRPPRGANESVFSHGLAGTIIIRGLLIGLTTLAVFLSLFRSTGDLETARTAALLALVMTQLIHVFECKSESRGLLSINWFDNMPLFFAVLVSIGAMFLTLYTGFFSKVFNAVPLTLPQLGVVAAYCAVVPIVNGIILRLRRARRRRKSVRAITA